MGRLLTRAVATGLLVLVVAEVVVVAGVTAGLVLLALAVWYALPGVLVAQYALDPNRATRTSAWLIGPALGFGLSVSGLLLLWLAGLSNTLALLVAPLLPIGMAMLIKRSGGIALTLPRLTHADRIGVMCALVLVPLITFAPYSKVRGHVPEGEAYRAYFTADFVWAMAATSELAKGDSPPDNPFRHGEPMRYYWLSHFLSGAVFAPCRASAWRSSR